jgi:RND family efflux transporter MFP subunit
MTMKRAVLFTLAVLVLAGTTALALPSSALHATAERPSPRASAPSPTTAGPSVLPELHATSDIRASNTQPVRDFLGVLVAREATEVAALGSGRIATIAVRIGDHVRAGQTLATLDARAQDLDLGVARSQTDEAHAELDVARSVAETATDADTREHKLGESGLASIADQAAARGARRAAELRAASAQATMLRQEASVRRLARERDETLVRAPFDGVVVARYLDPGANVTPDRPILRVVRNSEMIVRFALPEERANEVRVGMIVRALAPGSGTALDAVVHRISPEVDAAARWFVVEADAVSDATGSLVGEAADVFLTSPGSARP